MSERLGGSANPPRQTVTPLVAAPDQWRDIGQMLGGAFQDDPVWQWISRDGDRRNKHLGMMFAHAIRSRVEAGQTWTTHDIGGAAVWAKPGHWRMTASENVRSLIPSLRAIGATSIMRGLRALATIEKLHPSEPHWYLEFLAADASRRGQGFGSALIQPILDRCDEEGLPAYLESSKEANLPFYNRFGFEVTNRFHIGDDAPPMWAMWREPRMH